ncbi:LLM class flavin-dependent oxidoreductase [Coralloluteibacterium stylophorae]|uniref:Luciferase-like monooxygenase n=1 Tax=Coralloluteibacterium stylophorae TaxID=1776034 RepID=A0AAP2FY65_9GAMM|nr:LLM class flavin-dependent oxidoreductase [Coralloluteibacterium stylophorae]MBS7455610.1 LLM class flavin-dependent oxidoreductase [Coralloluteibacterium stylophorae]
MIPFSVLDLAPIVEGGTASDSFRNTLDLAQHAERWGFRRYWLAEHHNIPGIASAATAVVIAHVAAGTSTIRVGAGGVMLPNHAPLVIAEQFGTLAALHPGRIDLGLGRAPGSDRRTAHALRRDLDSSAEQFPQDVVELRNYFREAVPGGINAVPGAGLEVPMWILGSSLFGAQLAAALGLPYAFASHFAPDALDQALAVYRARYQPSEQWPEPYAMACVNVAAADSDAEARRVFTSMQQSFVNLRRNVPGLLPPPVEPEALDWTPLERQGVEHALAESFVGTVDTVTAGLRRFLERTRVDELMVNGQIFDHAARLRSFELTAQVRERLAA